MPKLSVNCLLPLVDSLIAPEQEHEHDIGQNQRGVNSWSHKRSFPVAIVGRRCRLMLIVLFRRRPSRFFTSTFVPLTAFA